MGQPIWVAVSFLRAKRGDLGDRFAHPSKDEQFLPVKVSS